MKSLKTFLKEKRKHAGLTQLEFAERAGVALTVIRKMEQGKENLNLEKVNHVLSMFGHCLAPVASSSKDVFDGLNVTKGLTKYVNKNTFTKYKGLLIAICMSLTVFSSNAQIQKGADIDGVYGDDGGMTGYSVSVADANTLAIGALEGGGGRGIVRVYNWSGTAWVQKGADINGEAARDLSGHSVSMPDDNTLAIGAIYNNGNGKWAGHVRVYNWSGNAWVQKGANINGEADGDESGFSVSMPDDNTLAIGAPENDGNGISAGHVRVYSWSGTAWVQKGADINGEATSDQSGFSVSMTDENTLAIGAPSGNSGPGPYNSGHVCVYSWSGNAWVQKGADIDGEAYDDKSGFSVSMPDANTLAIGAPENDGNGESAGHVRVYSWSGNAWVQKGADIDGEDTSNMSGFSVSMPDANTLAIGAPYNNGNGDWNAGHVRIYNWSGNAWVQKGANINGEADGDGSGFSVSMPDANTIAIGAPSNDGNDDAGHVRVYSMTSLDILENSLGNELEIYPNPAKNVINLKTADTKLLGMAYSIHDSAGKVVLSGKITSENTSIELGNLSAGIYMIGIAENMNQTFKLIRR